MTRLQIIWEIISHTPTWVWLIFPGLLTVEIKALKAKSVHIAELFILPSSFFLIAIHTLATEPFITWIIAFAFVISCIAFISIGWAITQGQKFTIDKKKWKLNLPGSSFTLILVMTIFASKYYFGYIITAHPEVAHTLAFKIMKFACSGGLTGLAIGRLACYMQRVEQEKSK
jgi:hypothetical protein